MAVFPLFPDEFSLPRLAKTTEVGNKRQVALSLAHIELNGCSPAPQAEGDAVLCFEATGRLKFEVRLRRRPVIAEETNVPVENARKLLAIWLFLFPAYPLRSVSYKRCGRTAGHRPSPCKKTANQQNLRYSYAI
jgi:hypothetical protein